MEGLGRCHFRLGWQGRSSLPKHSRMSDNPSPSPPPPETQFTPGQTVHAALFPCSSLQVWGVSLSLSLPPRWAGARTQYLPGQRGFPQMTVLASHTLSKLFFCTCLPEPAFLAMLSVKDSVPPHVPRHPLYGTWSPNAQVSSPLCKAQGCTGHLTSGGMTSPETSSNKPGLCVFSCYFSKHRGATHPCLMGPLSTPKGWILL